MQRPNAWSRRFVVAIWAVVICVVGGSAGFASTFLKADIPTLRQMSESVVHARVVGIRSAWNAEGTIIFTYITLDVIRTLHGRSRGRIVVRVPGGTVDGFAVKMVGAPQFHKGSAVAFIGSWDDGVPRVVGYFQGLSQVVPDRASRNGTLFA